MTVKSISTRSKICGRSAKCTDGHSAVEQSSYISREKMYCEYDGQTFIQSILRILFIAKFCYRRMHPKNTSG